MHRTPSPRGLRRAATLLIPAAVVGGMLLAASPAAATSGVHAEVRRGTLRIDGSAAGEAITLRLRAGDANKLEIDVGDDGFGDFSFYRDTFTDILLRGRAGGDTLRIDEVNGVFTDTEQTTMSGQAGADVLLGGTGAEVFLGGAGRDTMDGNRGNDTALMGGGNDSFTWDPGDGNDVLEGEAGFDTMVFNGAGGAETFDFSRDGNRLRFFRQPGNVLMSTDGLENVVVNALGSADVTTINDLTGTDVQKAIIDLGLTLGAAGGDGAADQVILNGTAGDDVITVSGGAGTVRADGLVPSLEMTDAEPADQLSIQTLDGNDTVDSAGLAPGTIQLLVDGV